MSSADDKLESSESTSKENQVPTADRPRTVASGAASSISLPLANIPERKSSASIFRNGATTSGRSSVQDFPSWKLPPPAAAGYAVPSRGRSNSPVRGAMQRASVSGNNLRRIPSKTLIRTSVPLDILDRPNSKHAGFEMHVHLASSVFVGGGTIEGAVKLAINPNINGKSREAMYITRLAIDVIGVEEVSDGRRWVFLSLANELFDEEHPPPASMVSSQTSVSTIETKWALRQSSAVLPFRVNLPLNIGPPTYLSKQARIRYILCPTAYIEARDRPSIVRQSWNIQMLTVYDPEKALSSLPSPLVASDQLSISTNPPVHIIKLTAGLHRQTWINGSSIFVDIHISNNSPKLIKKIELQLEKTTLGYSHAAAGTAEKSASYLRLPHKSESEIVSTAVLKKGREFAGIAENVSDVRTMALEVPRNQITISTGRYFEIRYFVNVVVSVAFFKTVVVQLPVTIIHMNSLDIVPNSLAQVAAAIEAKRSCTVPVDRQAAIYSPYHQGQAFSAPRRQSLERLRGDVKSAGDLGYEELNTLQREVDDSPRRKLPRKAKSSHHIRTISINPRPQDSEPHVARSQMDGLPVEVTQDYPGTGSHQHHSPHPSCYHCQVSATDAGHHRHRSSLSTPAGPKIPRLQVSTSGLGFSETEFELPPDSPPRKVMLSESERKVIQQERELRLARQRSIAHNRNTSDQSMVQGQTGSSSVQYLGRVGSRHSQGKMPSHGLGRTGSRRSNHHANGRSRSRTIPMTERDRGPRIPGPAMMTGAGFREIGPGDQGYWGWKNVAASGTDTSTGMLSRRSIDGIIGVPMGGNRYGDIGRRGSVGGGAAASRLRASYVDGRGGCGPGGVEWGMWR